MQQAQFLNTTSWLASDAALIDLDRELVRRGGLRAFIELAWHVIEPVARFVPNWHIDEICEELEDIRAGRNRRLLLAMPPRHMKSTILAVMFPVYVWIRNPAARMIFISYDFDNTIRDSKKTRDLINSEWFRARWGHIVKLRTDNVILLETDRTGERRCVSVAGRITGKGADIICFPGRETVATEFGMLPIKEIVEQRLKCNAWAFDPATGKVALRPIVGWHENPGSAIIRVTLSDGKSFECTPEHEIWTTGGWKPAINLTSDDVLPGFSVADGINRGAVDVEAPRQGSSTFLGKPDVPNIGFGENTFEMLLADGTIGLFAFSDRVMPPVNSLPDLVDGLALDAELCGQSGAPIWAIEDFVDLAICQLGAGMNLALREGSVPLGVFDVLQPGSVNQVAQSGVAPVPISVTDLASRRGRSNEHVHHDLMTEKLMLGACFESIEARVSFIGRRRKDAAFKEKHTASPEDRPINRSGAAERGDFVPRPIGDRRPTLIEFVGHEDRTYCLTVDDYHTLVVGKGLVLASNCMDDPHDVKDVESDAKRKEVLSFWWERVQSRLNDPKTGCFVVCHQRIGEQDVIGDTLKRQGHIYRYLCLPVYYDPTHPHLWPRDPRRVDGELLWPAHMPAEVIESYRATILEYGFAAQYQQRPGPREGGLFKKAWFPKCQLHELPADLDFKRGWDFAATVKSLTKSDPDYSATVKIGYSRARGKYYIVDAQRWRVDGGELDRIMVNTAKSDGTICQVRGPQDPGAAGKTRAEQMGLMLSGFSFVFSPVTGDKAVNAAPVASQAMIGNVYMLDAPWNDPFLDELASFPTGAHDDWVDAAAQAFKGFIVTDTGLLDYYTRLLQERQRANAPDPNRPLDGVSYEETNDLAHAFSNRKRTENT